MYAHCDEHNAFWREESELAKTFCRICPGFCAMDATVENGRVTSVRGDKDDPETRGYTCVKGLQNPELMYGPRRLLHPLMRDEAGALRESSLDAVLDDIAARLRRIIDEHGPRSVAVFMGTQAFFGAANCASAPAFAQALGTPSLYMTMTIDQSAKWVAAERIGKYNAGWNRFEESDVWLLAGSNPLVSVMGGPATSGFNSINPTKALRDAKARGMKFIVIDPRETETAKQADLFIQPRPGEDAALLGGILHVVLREGWHDQAFCDEYVSGVDALRAALAEFTPEAVGRRADVPPHQIEDAARIFARDSRRGLAGTGTGTDMGPHSNIAEHFAQALNVVCGRVPRAGDKVLNPGVLQAAATFHADVTPPARSFERGPFTRRMGLGQINGQFMTNELASEILMPGEGAIKALFCLGGNPAVALPDQAMAIRALSSLDLLVTIDPRLSATAKLATHVIAPTLPFERHDHTARVETQYNSPYAHYVEPIVAPPAGADVIDDWKVFWELARRLGLPMKLGTIEAGAEPTPATEEVLAVLAQGSRVPLNEVRAAGRGTVFDMNVRVQPRRDGHDARLEIASPDVLEETAAVARTLADPVEDDVLLLTVRRLREFMNSVLTEEERSRARIPQNPAFLHPDEIERRGLTEGERVSVASHTGSVEAVVRADPTLRRGVVSLAHCWGKGTDDPVAIPESTSRLVDAERDCQTINGMPVMTAIKVRVQRLPEPVAA